MLELALTAAMPVFVGILLASSLGAARGPFMLWACLAIVAVLASAWWGLRMTGAPFMQRFMAPYSVYLPPLILGGAILALLGRPRWRLRWSLPLAAGLAVVNLFLAQTSFVIGCAGGWWECP